MRMLGPQTETISISIVSCEVWGSSGIYWRFLEPACVRSKSLQSCLTLCNAMDGKPPGFSVHGVLQAGILEWVSMPSSRGPSGTRDQILVWHLLHREAGSLPLAPPGQPLSGARALGNRRKQKGHIFLGWNPP